jgi:N-acyl-L-homoserine lactone synthetase/HPt (histidine-containing phosphotransfer) domain-containing protein
MQTVELELPICDITLFERTAAFLTPEALSSHIGTLAARGTAMLLGLHGPSAKDLAKDAHNLAGSAGMFGFPRLAFAARQFEWAAKTASPEISAFAQRLVAALDVSLVQMRLHVAEVVPPSQQASLSPTQERSSEPPIPTSAAMEPEAIAAVRRDFVVDVADTHELILDTQRLRYQVYCVERGFETSSDGIERDHFDSRSHHIMLRRRSNDEVVGTTRVVLYNSDAVHDSYPMQRVCDRTLLLGLPLATTAEVSRFAISKHRRGDTSPSLMRLALIQGVFRVSYEVGLTHWCAIMESSLLRLLKSSGIHFRPLGPLVEYHGPRQPCWANIAEVASRMQTDHPEVWTFTTQSGAYVHSNHSVTIRESSEQKRATHSWQSTVSGGGKWAYFPNFEKAALTVIDNNAPPQHYQPRTLVRQ